MCNKNCQFHNVFFHLQICESEGLFTDMSTLIALCKKSSSDIRSCLNTLQVSISYKRVATRADFLPKMQLNICRHPRPDRFFVSLHFGLFWRVFWPVYFHWWLMKQPSGTVYFHILFPKKLPSPIYKHFLLILFCATG